MRPVVVAECATSSTSLSTSTSTPLRNALLPPPSPRMLATMIPQSREEEAASLEKFSQGLPVVVKELIAGGAAGAIAKTCVAPLERVKILFQTGRMKESGGGNRNSIPGTLVSIMRNEGVRGLFKGNGASVLRIVPYSALHFGAYEQYREWMVRALRLESEVAGEADGEGGRGKQRKKKRRQQRVPPWVDLLAGSGAGATAVLATYPLDLARTRLAYDMEGGVAEAEAAKKASSTSSSKSKSSYSKSTVRSVLRATVAEHGFRGLYCGIGPTLAGILPYAGLKFYVYQSAKHAHLSSVALGDGGDKGKGGRDEGSSSSSSSPHRPSVAVTLAFGAAAGLVAQTATYPLDVVRRQMQVAGLAQAQAARVGGGGGGGSSSGGGVGATVAAPTTTAAASAPPCPSPTATNAMPRSTLAGLRSVWRSGGLRAAFAGVSINYLKVVPSTAIGFSTYDALKSYLGLSHNL